MRNGLAGSPLGWKVCQSVRRSVFAGPLGMLVTATEAALASNWQHDPDIALDPEWLSGWPEDGCSPPSRLLEATGRPTAVDSCYPPARADALPLLRRAQLTGVAPAPPCGATRGIGTIGRTAPRTAFALAGSVRA